MTKTKLLAAVSALCLMSGSALADLNVQAPAVNPFVGLSAAPHSIWGDLGAVYSLDQDLNKDGWLARGEFFAGTYDYNHPVGPRSVKQDVTYEGGSAMGGYHWHLQNQSLFSLYGGLEVQNHDNNDTSAKVRGTRVGPKLLAEYETPFFNNQFYSYNQVTYSTNWNSYYAMTKVGYRATTAVSVGPELAFLGSDRFSNVRTGGFVGLDVTNNIQLIGSVGYSFDTYAGQVNADSGAYGTLHIRTEF